MKSKNKNMEKQKTDYTDIQVKKWQKKMFWMMWITYASFYLGRVNISIALPSIANEFNLSKTDFNTNYLSLLSQLSAIDPQGITFDTFYKFVDKLNSNHIIKIIKNKNTKKIVGTVTILIEEKLLHNNGRVGHIEDLVIDESMRGCGLGKKILDIAKNECKNCYKIILNCNDNNIDFYNKCGYMISGSQMRNNI